MIVADCSLIARLIIAAEDPAPARALWLRDSEWAAPVLWEPEFASVLLKYERAGLLSPAGAAAHRLRAEEIFERTTYHLTIDRALMSARRSGCSSYDGYYVALAEDLDVKLYTYDKGILRK
ncbi:MAG: type II toxin-antitoxin system VapC family toxin, partial [Chthoniobacterales bacterium]